jgi:hypothetical protein
MSSESHKEFLLLFRRLDSIVRDLGTLVDTKWEKLSMYEVTNVIQLAAGALDLLQEKIQEKES